MSSTPKLSTSSTSALPAHTEDRSAVFAELFEADKTRLYAYIYAYMADRAATDDIFQETCLALWQDFAKFQLGSNFVKWANGVAFNRVRAYRRKHDRYALGLTDDFLIEFQQDIAITEKEEDHSEVKWQHLSHCSEQLPSTLKDIYTHFYINSMTAQDLADNTGRSIYAIRKAIRKLRKLLFDCVEDKQQELL